MKYLFGFALLGITACTTATKPLQLTAHPGKQIAFSRDKGNCLACHEIEDGEFPGNIGPELKELSTRFNSKQELREQIWDATYNNPETSMPPFGKNKILTETEIDQVVDYLWGIK
jgi:L-cysteine S-thiosulfotransferase